MRQIHIALRNLSKYPCLLTAFFLPVVLAAVALGADQRWKPVEPAQLAMKEPVVEKDAPAEVLFWEMNIDDRGSKTIFKNYVRIKIFTAHGADTQGKVQITYSPSEHVTDIAARTVKPDGSIMEVKTDGILEQKVLRTSELALNSKTIVFPAVEAGCLIEYRYREERSTPGYFRVDLQRDIPVQIIDMRVAAQPYLRFATFNSSPIYFTEEKGGMMVRRLTNLPALKKEPHMPPMDSIRLWMLFYYRGGSTTFESSYGKMWHQFYEPRMRVNDTVRQVARELAGSTGVRGQTLRQIYEYCRDKIGRPGASEPEINPKNLDRFKENKSPSDTLKQKKGTGEDIDLLFAALASAAGYKVRMVRLADRSSILYGPETSIDAMIPYLLSSYHVAVQIGDQWEFYDPAGKFLPFGMLRWQEEGLRALICDPAESVILQTPMTPPEKSLVRRVANLKLEEDGTLEGNARLEIGGHPSVDLKDEYSELPVAEREKKIRDQIKSLMNTAEVSQVVIENSEDPERPLVYSYRIRVPGYTQRTGSRLFFQPAYFQRGNTPRFPSNENRKFPVYFHYPWCESDSVTVQLPDGFRADKPEGANGTNLQKDILYSTKILISDDGRTLTFSREFSLGNSGNLLFENSRYPVIKSIFDLIQEIDNRTVALRRTQAPNK